MNKKMRKFPVAYIAVALSFILVLATAFSHIDVKGEITPLNDTNTAENSSSSAAPDESSSNDTSNTKSNLPENNKTEKVKVTFNFNGGTGTDKTRYVSSGTKVGDLETPVKKGYKFTGWTNGGNNILSDFKIEDDIYLTAQWEKIKTGNTVSSVSSKSPSTSYKPVDTHQSEVNAAASDAEAALSDPDTLSSEDWSDIFSSGGNSSSSSASAAGTLTSQNGSNSSGGGSWLFTAGITLIILAVCGIALFIYLQFFHTPRKNRKRDLDDTLDIDSFTDINSDSSGTQKRDDSDDTQKSVLLNSSAEPKLQKKAAPEKHTADKKSGLDNTKAQAKPVNGSQSDFDWDKFFNDDDL